MFKRTLFRQQRALAQSLSRTAQSQRSAFSSFTSTPLRATPAITQQLGRRWQSTEAEKKADEAAKPAEDAPKTEEDPVKKELEAKSKEVVDLKDKYLRSVADFRNLQERTKREVDNAKQFAIQRFASDLLDSIDNLDRALSAVPEASLKPADATTSNTSSADPNTAAATETSSEASPQQDLINLHSGLKMTEDILMNTLKKHGLERFDPAEREGKKFDPNQDEATFFLAQEGKADGEVFFTQSKGFKLNGRVIRAAKVGVVKNS